MVGKWLVPENNSVSRWQVLGMSVDILLFLFLERCKLNSYLKRTHTFFSSEKMQKVHLVQHQSHRVVCLRVYTVACVYKVQGHTFFFIVWQQIGSHHFCVVAAEVLGFVLFFSFFL